MLVVLVVVLLLLLALVIVVLVVLVMRVVLVEVLLLLALVERLQWRRILAMLKGGAVLVGEILQAAAHGIGGAAESMLLVT